MSPESDADSFDAFLEDQLGIKRPKSPDIGCFQCGWCCRYYKIFITPEEADFISRETGKSMLEICEFSQDINWLGGENLFLLRGAGGCVFLKNIPGAKRSLCSIHKIKPVVCCKFQASLEKPACQQGLAEVWGLIVGRSGGVEGADGKLSEFYDFLREING